MYAAGQRVNSKRALWQPAKPPALARLASLQPLSPLQYQCSPPSTHLHSPQTSSLPSPSTCLWPCLILSLHHKPSLGSLTPLPNHPHSLKCSVSLPTDKATDYLPITKPKDFCFLLPLKNVSHISCCWTNPSFFQILPPRYLPPWFSSHFRSDFCSPILNCIIPQVCTQSPTCCYSCLESIRPPAFHLHASIHPKQSSSSSSFLLTFLGTVNVYTKILFHRELNLKDSFPLPPTSLLPTQSQGPVHLYSTMSREATTFFHLYCRPLYMPSWLLIISDLLAHNNECVPFIALTTTILLYWCDCLINAMWPNHERNVTPNTSMNLNKYIKKRIKSRTMDSLPLLLVSNTMIITNIFNKGKSRRKTDY